METIHLETTEIDNLDLARQLAVIDDSLIYWGYRRALAEVRGEYTTAAEIDMVIDWLHMVRGERALWLAVDRGQYDTFPKTSYPFGYEAA